MSLTFKQLRNANQTRLALNFSQCHDWTAADWMTALTGEVGELANMLKKRRTGQVVIPDVEIEKEIADIQIYLDLLALFLKVDLAQATISKFNEVSQRSWVNSPVRLYDEVTE